MAYAMKLSERRQAFSPEANESTDAPGANKVKREEPKRERSWPSNLFGAGKDEGELPKNAASVEQNVLPSSRLLDERQQAVLLKSRNKDEVARVVADRNRWFAICVALLVGLLVTANGWRVANDRFANNVQVSWVKLDPSGAYTVEFAQERAPVQFFERTLEAKLIEFVERRFSKYRNTIGHDYGFAYTLMTPQLQTRFLEEFGAAKKATEHERCEDCGDVAVEVRHIQHLDDEHTNDERGREKVVYRSIVFVTETMRNAFGSKVAARNKVINLVWRLKNYDEIMADKKNLRENPIGIEIIRSTVKDDATPVEMTDKR